MLLPDEETQFFESALFTTTGLSHTNLSVQFVSGGCINTAARLTSKHGSYFLKWNESRPADMFRAEATGLQLLRESRALRVPEVLGWGQVGSKAFLVLEFIESRYPSRRYWEELGTGLANLHRQTSPTFGLDAHNYIGYLEQQNTPAAEWGTFFIEQRLRPQFGLAYYNGLIDAHYLRLLDQLALRVEEIFLPEPPALLHGDLWSGNVMAGFGGEPVIFDPAVYYGHREMELAFTKLFGGFEPGFYDAYHEAYPLADGHEERVALCNLYPLMVHVNLFGTGYLGGVKTTLERFS